MVGAESCVYAPFEKTQRFPKKLFDELGHLATFAALLNAGGPEKIGSAANYERNFKFAVDRKTIFARFTSPHDRGSFQPGSWFFGF